MEEERDLERGMEMGTERIMLRKNREREYWDRQLESGTS